MSDKLKPKILTRLRINEVSLVDRGAGEQCRVVISKREEGADSVADGGDNIYDENWYRQQVAASYRMNEEHLRESTGAADHEPADDEPENPFSKIFQGVKIPESSARALAKVAKLYKSSGDLDAENGDEDEATPVDELDGPPPPLDGTVETVSDKTITFDVGDKTITARDERALARWLSVQERITHKSNSPQESITMSTIDLSAVVKAYGLTALTKYMTSEGTSFGVSESELTTLATEHAKRVYPDDRGDVAFAKFYSSEDGASLRRAIEIAKNASFTGDAEAEADAAAACRELQAIGKARWGSLTPSQQFARAFETNPELAKRAHRRPSVFGTSFPFPRG